MRWDSPWVVARDNVSCVVAYVAVINIVKVDKSKSAKTTCMAYVIA